jgi:lipopolysaccharide export system permease protein
MFVWTTQAVSRIDFATGSGGSIVSFLHFMVLLIPQFLVAVLPFGIVVGSVQVLNTMNTDSELPVVAGAGISRLRIAKPFLLIGALCSAYVFVSSHSIEPITNSASRDVLTESRTNLLTSLIQEGRFTKATDNLTIYVDEKTSEGLKGIMISDTRDPKTSLIYYAKLGAIGVVDDQSLLVMQDGEIHRKSPRENSVTVIRFQSYAINLSQFSSAESSTRYLIYERPTSFLLNPDQSDKFVKQNPGQVKAELHKRMSSWMYPILMSLVALVLAGNPRSHRTTKFSNYVLAFGTALFYYGLSQWAYHINKVDADHLYLIYLIPLFGITLSFWMYMNGRTLETPDFVLIWFDNAKAKFNRIRFRTAPNAAVS